MPKSSGKLHVSPYHYYLLIKFVELSAVKDGIPTIPKVCEFIYQEHNRHCTGYEGSSFSNIKNRNPYSYSEANTLRTTFLLAPKSLLFTRDMLERMLSYQKIDILLKSWDDFILRFSGQSVCDLLQSDNLALFYGKNRNFEDIAIETLAKIKRFAIKRVNNIYLQSLRKNDVAFAVGVNYIIRNPYAHELEFIDKLETAFRGLDFSKKIDRKTLITKNKNIYAVCECEGQICYSVMLLPLKRHAFEQLKKGQLKEFDITSEDIFSDIETVESQHFLFTLGSAFEDSRDAYREVDILSCIYRQVSWLQIRNGELENKEIYMCTFGKINTLHNMLGYRKVSSINYRDVGVWSWQLDDEFKNLDPDIMKAGLECVDYNFELLKVEINTYISNLKFLQTF